MTYTMNLPLTLRTRDVAVIKPFSLNSESNGSTIPWFMSSGSVVPAIGLGGHDSGLHGLKANLVLTT